LILVYAKKLKIIKATDKAKVTPPIPPTKKGSRTNPISAKLADILNE
jgi:hypothetical protein